MANLREMRQQAPPLLCGFLHVFGCGVVQARRTSSSGTDPSVDDYLTSACSDASGAGSGMYEIILKTSLRRRYSNERGGSDSQLSLPDAADLKSLGLGRIKEEDLAGRTDSIGSTDMLTSCSDNSCSPRGHVKGCEYEGAKHTAATTGLQQQEGEQEVDVTCAYLGIKPRRETSYCRRDEVLYRGGSAVQSCTAAAAAPGAEALATADARYLYETRAARHSDDARLPPAPTRHLHSDSACEVSLLQALAVAEELEQTDSGRPAAHAAPVAADRVMPAASATLLQPSCSVDVSHIPPGSPAVSAPAPPASAVSEGDGDASAHAEDEEVQAVLALMPPGKRVEQQVVDGGAARRLDFTAGGGDEDGSCDSDSDGDDWDVWLPLPDVSFAKYFATSSVPAGLAAATAAAAAAAPVVRSERVAAAVTSAPPSELPAQLEVRRSAEASAQAIAAPVLCVVQLDEQERPNRATLVPATSFHTAGAPQHALSPRSKLPVPPAAPRVAPAPIHTLPSSRIPKPQPRLLTTNSHSSTSASAKSPSASPCHPMYRPHVLLGCHSERAAAATLPVRGATVSPSQAPQPAAAPPLSPTSRPIVFLTTLPSARAATAQPLHCPRPGKPLPSAPQRLGLPPTQPVPPQPLAFAQTRRWNSSRRPDNTASGLADKPAGKLSDATAKRLLRHQVRANLQERLRAASALVRRPL